MEVVMKKIWILLVLMISSSAYSYVETCQNFAPRDDVSFQYNRCVERNFESFEPHLNILFERCFSFGGYDNRQFIRCINRNFNRAGIELSTGIPFCDNWHIGRPQYPLSLSRSFQDCVNRNFRQVDFLIRRRL